MNLRNKSGLIFLISILGWALFLAITLNAQSAIIKEDDQVFRTYPFSDPSPVAEVNKTYPYFRFDGYSLEGSDRPWKIVTLENPYIKVLIAPEIGGKVLGAFEKSTGRAFIYFNRVVKFRNIAMRGPWTSGGIEFNFGSIGHTPTTATPVDYITRKNEDGSVSCIVGAMDLSSRTEWRVEIRLPKDKACFETHSFWYNPTALNTSLYHWMNASADATDDLRYYFPGSHYITHGGIAFPWHITDRGRDISYYKNNDFGSSKSYHVLGMYTDFFAGYYENSDFGFCHWSLYPDKPGKKIWIWALSRQGQIWKELLTDPELGNEQYTEIQTGLLFNQAGGSSRKTPFKHLFFPPNDVEKFSEIWFPVKDIGGVSKANRYGSLNAVQHGQNLIIGFCPIQEITDSLRVKLDGKTIYSRKLNLKPMQSFVDSVKLDHPGKFEVIIGNKLITYRQNEANEKKLRRPLAANKDFDWNSATGLCTRANEYARQRDYHAALQQYLACLEKDPVYNDALIGAAEIYYRRLEFDKALDFVLRALANDTYQADANFIYGIICKKLGRKYDAKDGFGIAARSMKFRSAAYCQLAEIFFQEGRLLRAAEYANRALDYNRYNLNALKLLSIIFRKQNRVPEAGEMLSRILEIDPLNHFARFEAYLSNPRSKRLKNFTLPIRNELPQETLLELAIDYANLGLPDEGILVLQNAPEHPMVNYWLSYLYSQRKDFVKSDSNLKKALAASPELVYPFRTETAAVLQWALSQQDHWKTKYYLALIFWSRDRLERARQLFKACGDQPNYAPFYLTRGKFFKPDDVDQTLLDYQKALELAPDTWRPYHALVAFYHTHNSARKMLKIARQAAAKFPANYIVVYDYARALLYNNRFDKCLAVLRHLTILPHEGARSGHETYRQACLLYAMEKMKRHDFKAALALIDSARIWHENLGVGRPYLVDERIENFMAGLCREKTNHTKEARRLFDEIIAFSQSHLNARNSKLYIYALALKRMGKETEARNVVADWLKAAPTNPVARWSAANFRIIEPGDLDCLSDDKTDVVEAPWNPIKRDTDFKLVYEIAKLVEQID